MTLPRYPAYKDSGVEWLGEIPEHWDVVRLKHILDELGSGGTPDTSRDSNWANASGIPWVAIGDMSDRDYVAETQKALTTEGIEEKRLTVWPVGTLLFSMYASLGHVAELRIAASINQAILALLPKKEVDQSFLKRWFQFLRPRLKEVSSSNTQDNLNAEKVRNLIVLKPPKAEQRGIATFLDHETSKIDALIAEQKNLIALLKEKRQAVISHAVTKGLHPDVPMKDSGVEWLGEVPEHWEVRKASHIGRIFGSDNVPEDMISNEGDLPYLKVGSLSVDGVEVSNWGWYLDSVAAETYRACDNYIVFPKRGAAIFLNKVNVVSRPALIDPNLMGWEIGASNNTLFFAYALKSKRLDELADVSTVPQINNKHIGPVRFPVPPLAEQEAIADFLKNRVFAIEMLVGTAESTIQLLHERRSALISAAVTGKIDVRGLVAQEAA